MYVCICHGVTEREISDLLARGASTPKQIADVCRAGTGCGTCVEKIRALISESSAGCGNLSAGTTTTADDRRDACVAIRRS